MQENKQKKHSQMKGLPLIRQKETPKSCECFFVLLLYADDWRIRDGEAFGG
jgi:hypothetical protein